MMTWAFWAYAAVTLGFLLFVLFYAFGSPGWWRGRAGRAIMLLSFTLVIVLANTLLTVGLGPDWVGRGQVRVAILVGAFTSGWYLFYTLLQEQRRGRAGRFGRPQPPKIDRRSHADRRKNN